MTIFCLELRSTESWGDCRYRDYTTSEKKAEAFQKIPKIRFTDSGHGIVPSVTVHTGRKRLPTVRVLADYVKENV